MKKNIFMSIISAAVVFVTSVTCRFSTVAADVPANPCNFQDNREVAYIDLYSPNPNTKITFEEASQSPVKPQIVIDKVGLSLDMATRNRVQTVNFVLMPGAENTLSDIKLHIMWDTRLTIVPQPNNRLVKKGEAIRVYLLEENTDNVAHGVLEVNAIAAYPENGSGVLFSIDFRYPDTINSGDVFPIGISYQNNGTEKDLFMGTNPYKKENKLMDAYLFTQGISNGYMKILGGTNPTAPTGGLGDVNGDGVVNSSDASLVLAEYSAIQTGGKTNLTNKQKFASDVNSDGVFDSIDASKILAYYAMTSTGKTPTWD